MIANAESIIKWAMEIADELPEKYQAVAFAELLRYALKTTPVSEEPGTEERPEGRPSPPPSYSLLEKLCSECPDDHLVADKASRPQQIVWAVINLCEQGQEATTASVRDLIKTQLSMKPPSETRASHLLGGLVPEYLKREKRSKGRGYSYSPKATANEIFRDLKE